MACLMEVYDFQLLNKRYNLNGDNQLKESTCVYIPGGSEKRKAQETVE